MKDFRLAICQNKPLYDKKKTVQRILDMIRKASDNGAKLVSLPEMFYFPYDITELIKQEEENRETVSVLQSSARENNIYLCTGTTVDKINSKRFNKSYLISPDGKILLEYAKCHLFDVEFKELQIKESDSFSPGDYLNIADTEIGRIGIIICYDIRFPEMARALALKGAEIILVPAAFNAISGNAHWHLFFRTRATENQVFIAASCPAKNDDCKYKYYGHSMIIDPWGDILSEAGENEEIIYADIKQERLQDVRNRLPLLKHARKDLYRNFLDYC